MKDSRICARCGTMLSDASSGGFCVRCIVRDAFETSGSAHYESDRATADQQEGSGVDLAMASRQFGDYELIETIAHGGMGVVYKARQRSLNRIVALKILQTSGDDGPAAIQRFENEARAAARLKHAHIVAVHDFGVWHGRQFLSMDHIEGSDLHGLCSRQPFEAARAARLVKTIAEAMHFAHQQGVLHRDLKPSNVLIDNSDQPHVTDFGLAQSIATDLSLTLSGQTLGTPQYLPPEQASVHRGETGPWSDVYSIGSILYHLLTGRPPFVAGRAADVLQQVLFDAPIAPRALNPGVPRDLETICLKCLEKDPRRRYPTADALADELGRYLSRRPISARPVGRVERMWRWCRRQPVVALLCLTLGLTLLLGFAGVLWQWQRAKAGELAARQNAYDSDMILVQLALAEGDLGHARTLLNRQRPLKHQVDLRHWEWRYRWQQGEKDPAWRRSLFQHKYAIRNVVLSADGKWLIVAAVDGMVALVDLATGRAVVLQSASRAPPAVAVDPDSRLVAFTQRVGNYEYSAVTTVQEEGQIRLRDMAAGREILTIDYEGRIWKLGFSSDRKSLIALASDKTWTGRRLLVWDIESRSLHAKAIITATGTSNTIISATSAKTEGDSLAISPTEGLVAVRDSDGQVQIFSQPTWDRSLAFSAHEDTVTALAFSPDGQVLATGGGGLDTSVRLWNPHDGQPVAPPLSGHNRSINAIAFSPDGKVVASASADQSIRLWEVASGHEVRLLRGHAQEVMAVAYLPDGHGLVSGCKDGSVWLWDPRTTDVARGTPLTANGILQFTFLPDSTSGAVVTTEGVVQIWELDDLRVQETIEALGSDNRMVASSPDGRLLASTNASGKVGIWDIKQRRRLPDLTAASEKTFVFLKFTSDGSQLVTAALEPTCPITRWDVATWAQTGKWELGVTPITGDVSTSGRFAVAGLNDGSLAVLDCATGRSRRLRVAAGAITSAAFSRDETILATGNDQGALSLWNTKTWQLLCLPLSGHRLPIYRIAFSDDGRRIATAGGSGQEAVILWDVPTRRPIATLQGDGENFNWISFSPDGNTIASVALDVGKLNLWRAPSLNEIDDPKRSF